jgi:hypothetical protein
MTGLALADACARLAELPPDAAVVCSECGAIELAVSFVDCSDLAAFAGLCCADCEDELISLGHYETCSCGSCGRRRKAADRERRQAESLAFGGIRPEFAAALGLKEDA